jgi:cysteine synthase A
VDYLVCGVGTGGTLSGAGEFLKEKNPKIKIIAVEPAGSPAISLGESGVHGIQGIGAGFVPKTLNTDIIDEVICVADADAISAARLVVQTDGLLAGISSGAALHAATQIACRPEAAGRTVVVIFPDSGERYLSASLFE